VRVDAGGAVIDELGDADAALLTPSHQFPSGVCPSSLSGAERLWTGRQTRER
jgi:DNA-binding transcriptional MocR family regulator